MYLIVIAWTYVTLMMAVAEATSPQGSLLGALVTFVLYGVLPMSILVYILATPSRKRAIKVREAQEQAEYDAQQAAAVSGRAESHSVEDVNGSGPAPTPVAAPAGDRPGAPPPGPDAPLEPVPTPASTAPDAGRESAARAETDSVAPVRKEP